MSSSFLCCDITSWRQDCLPTPPQDDAHLSSSPTKRKRAMSFPIDMATSQRSNSPKRQRTDPTDNVLPEQSASQISWESLLTLNKTNTFSPPESRISSRPSSPSRETPLILRTAWPPVLIESLNGLPEPPPEPVEQLIDRLATGVDFGFIPRGLKNIMKNDTEVGHQPTRSSDFDNNDARSEEELLDIWQPVKTIFLNARDCKDCSRDENAWCDDVVRPLLQLSMKLYGKDKWWLQSVQTQAINPLYLSTIPAPTSSDPSRRKPIDRKADYAFSYSHRDKDISALYKQLDAANKRDIAHTLDAFTKRTALFSGSEIKPASGDHTEAELQASIWIAASLQKKQELARAAQLSIEPAGMVEPVQSVVGHEHSLYCAYPRDDLVSGRPGVHVLGPVVKQSTDSIRGVFALVRLYGNILAYGMDAGPEGYWGRFFGQVLHSLACSSDCMLGS